jgi:glycine betaine/choline ABC-type transport system substrate-binding protein
MRHRTRRRILACLLVTGIAALAYFVFSVRREDQHITVGWKNSVEESILAEILIQRIEQRVGTALVVRHPPLDGTQAAHEALVVNEVDLCPEYAGSALVSVLRLPPAKDALSVREQVRENYRTRFQIEWIGPLGFDSTTVLVAPKDLALRLNAATISALAASRERFRLAVSKDFALRDSGVPLLARSYKLSLRGAPQLLDEARLYTALDNSQVDAVSASVTDGWIQSGKYAVLADDKQVFPPNEAGILVRSSTLEKFPPLGGALRGLCGKIDSATIRQMNAAVALQKRRPAEVAAEFLKSAGLR